MKGTIVRVSEHFKLPHRQPSLDFVDVPIASDVPIFIEPRALENLRSPWGFECVALLQNYFETALEAVRKKDRARLERIFGQLHEPAESHLGYTVKGTRGSGIGAQFSAKLTASFLNSHAAKSGLLKDLEDTVLMIDGISIDRISDITTNILRQPLIHYTQEMCIHHGIKLSPGIASGPMWDPSSKLWFQEYVDLPLLPSGPLLLIPKIITRKVTDYDANFYYNWYIVTKLQKVELARNSALVEVLKKTKKRRVTKKSVIQKYGRGKSKIAELTAVYPEILKAYRNDKKTPSEALSHEQLTKLAGVPEPHWGDLINQLQASKPGKDDAKKYEHAIEGILSALFYPELTHPQKQTRIHDGRKIIDLTYANNSQKGFFSWVSRHYICAFLFVECKNYVFDIKNPEFDQLAGRFSPQRGQVGFILCRTIEDDEAVFNRARDAAKDHRGYMIVLSDNDLKKMVEWRRLKEINLIDNFLTEKFKYLIS